VKAKSVAPEPDHLPLALLIDRDADTRHMYAEFLHGTTCEIDEAEDGREGLAKALTRHPDIIVTETRLPGISGFDLCRLIREDTLTHDIPIVVVTADAFEADVTRARAAGADAVLTKPCLPDQLASAIQRVLNQSNDLRGRAGAVRTRATEQLTRSESLLEHSRATTRRVMLSRAHNRRDTTTPPAPPPSLLCPTCDQPLRYVKSHIGGVSERHPEQWDYYECAVGCGTHQYRQRTHKLRRVS
jgi:two-component system, cell cycle response regulator DivK